MTLASYRCDDCGASGCTIFITAANPPAAFCDPHCAAAAGAWPWVGADLVVRMRWPQSAPGGTPAIQET